MLGISLTILTGDIETFTVVTMTGPEATFDIDVPADAMQGTIFALTESCREIPFCGNVHGLRRTKMPWA